MTPDTALARTGRRELIFDVDGSQYGPWGAPCSLCNVRQDPTVALLSFVRVREKLGDHSEHVAYLCPDCVARAMIQVERCGLWRQLSGAVAAAVKRVLSRRQKLVLAEPTVPAEKVGKR